LGRSGSGHFAIAQYKEDETYTWATKVAMRTLFRLLAGMLPAEARLAPQVNPETIRRCQPIVSGFSNQPVHGNTDLSHRFLARSSEFEVRFADELAVSSR
jgi:hypothetical protein